MILILTDENDLHGDAVVQKLKLLNVEFVRFNLNKNALLNTTATFKSGVWHIRTETNFFTTEAITCVWNRKTYVELLLEEHNDTTADFKIWKGEWNKTLLGIYLKLKNVFWLNHYRNNQRAESKYLQQDIASELAFIVPDILVSNDKKELVDFASRYESVVLKLMHQDFYKVGDNDYQGIYVNKISLDSLEAFGDIGENPIVVQQYIEKSYEVRYTVVGDSHFVCKIESQKSEKTKTDWRRYDIPNTPHSIIVPPMDIRDKVKLLLEKLELNYGALDFIVTPDNKWYFLEINPNGQYLWIEDLAGLEISNSIAKLLSSKINF